MNKIFVSVISLLVVVMSSFFLSPQDTYAKNDCSKYQGGKKVIWGDHELKKGQIGRLIVLKDTELYKLNGEKRENVRILKAGEFYRIYSFKQNALDVGGGYFVDRDNKVKYETPSKALVQAVECYYQNYLKSQVIIKDPLLEKEIRKILNKTKGHITVSEMQKIKFLDLRGYRWLNLKTVDGLEHAINLEEIEFSINTKKMDIKALSNLQKLKMLNISTASVDVNQINNIPNLEVLYLMEATNKDLATISKYPSKRLRYLEVAGKITDISSISKLKQLKGFGFTYNQSPLTIEKFDLPNLETLKLTNSGIIKIQNLNLPKLRDLSLGENKIENIQFLSNLPHLRNLSLENNKIKDITLIEKLPNLEYFRIDNNPLNAQSKDKLVALKEKVDNNLRNQIQQLLKYKYPIYEIKVPYHDMMEISFLNYDEFKSLHPESSVTKAVYESAISTEDNIYNFMVENSLLLLKTEKIRNFTISVSGEDEKGYYMTFDRYGLEYLYKEPTYILHDPDAARRGLTSYIKTLKYKQDSTIKKLFLKDFIHIFHPSGVTKPKL
ncbi:leucine-rich repeat domain-containing protein [Cytobacillus praedii]|uniref:leucine-rich repeat domain-containing protein n=1 Tax=Cytobacillus praedii TaxID=1742358 RepID=UPI003F7CE251